MSTELAVTTVEALEDRWVRIGFSDGSVHDVDLGPMFARGGVFAPIRDDRSIFEAVHVDTGTGAVTWPGDVDLDTLVLHGDFAPASGVELPRRVIQTA